MSTYPKSWTVKDVVDSLPEKPLDTIPAPRYYESLHQNKIGLAVESMKRHMTDEGWQIFAGLESAGYTLCGHDLPFNSTFVPYICEHTNPGTLVLQDKREWDVRRVGRGQFRDPQARFVRFKHLKNRNDIFKVTILKDAHHNNEYHRESADEIDCHAWIIYYHPEIVLRHAPYVRPRHLIRVYHTIDADIVTPYSPHNRAGAILSGAVSSVYPLRQRLARSVANLPEVDYLPHPGYHRNGCITPLFLHGLNKYKVSICTASRYGYVLRKIIESTACGCVVLTDLPEDEVVPEIDDNLVRIHPDTPTHKIAELLKQLYSEYNAEKQQYYAIKAKAYYDYRVAGARLAEEIENQRLSYLDYTRS